MTDILTQDPPSGTVPYLDIVDYDDGSEPLGTVTQVIGGSNSRGIARQESLVIDPRLTSNAVSDDGTFGGNASGFTATLISDLSSSDPVASAAKFIAGHQRGYLAGIKDLASDLTIKHIAQNEETYSLSPAQVLGEVIKSGIGASVLADASNVAANVELTSGSGVIGVEVGAIALALGAVSHDFDNLTGNHTISQVESHIGRAFTSFAQGSIRHNG